MTCGEISLETEGWIYRKPEKTRVAGRCGWTADAKNPQKTRVCRNCPALSSVRCDVKEFLFRGGEMASLPRFRRFDLLPLEKKCMPSVVQNAKNPEAGACPASTVPGQSRGRCQKIAEELSRLPHLPSIGHLHAGTALSRLKAVTIQLHGRESVRNLRTIVLTIISTGLAGMAAFAWAAEPPLLWIEGESAARSQTHHNAWFEAVDPAEPLRRGPDRQLLGLGRARRLG